MKDLFYCTKCLMPSTKPYIRFNADGVCDACDTHRLKENAKIGIDWKDRERRFDELVGRAKAIKAPLYDALVPVSGGKDSITQVHRLLKYGLRILAVNVDYGIKTRIGEQNLDCIPKMGAHLIRLRPEQTLHKRLIRIGFEDFGDPDLLSHTLLHAYPLHVAANFKIPLVALGENSAFEYGGDQKIAESYQMSHDWFLKYAANGGRDARYISETYDISYERLVTYDYPQGFDSSEINAVFLSYFFRWDSEAHLEIAKSHGFRELDEPNEGTYRKYVGIDEKINRIHQYMKVLKFGYGRATDHACEDIRSGKIDRETAKRLVQTHDLRELSSYYVNDFCDYLGYSKQEFRFHLERWRNAEIWKKDDKVGHFIPNHLNLDRQFLNEKTSQPYHS